VSKLASELGAVAPGPNNSAKLDAPVATALGSDTDSLPLSVLTRTLTRWAIIDEHELLSETKTIHVGIAVSVRPESGPSPTELNDARRKAVGLPHI